MLRKMKTDETRTTTSSTMSLMARFMDKLHSRVSKNLSCSFIDHNCTTREATRKAYIQECL